MIPTVPHIDPAMPSEVYHGADATPEPALSSGLAVVMTRKCPRKVWAAHPALNPQFVAPEKRQFDLGSGAHARLLEAESFQDKVEIILAPNYRTKAAQEARDAAYAAGQTPLLEDEMAEIEDMVAEVMNDPVASVFLQNGFAERSHFWIDRPHDVWCKTRPDYYVPRLNCTEDMCAVAEWDEPQSFIVNYKTTGTSIDPETFGKHVSDLDYVQRAAWEMRGVEMTTGERVDRYLLVAQETEAPYLVSVYQILQNDLEYGASFNRSATAEFAQCLARGRDKRSWPGYRAQHQPDRDGVIPLDLPAWKRMRMEQQRINLSDRQKIRQRDKKVGEKSAAVARYYAP